MSSRPGLRQTYRLRGVWVRAERGVAQQCNSLPHLFTQQDQHPAARHSAGRYPLRSRRRCLWRGVSPGRWTGTRRALPIKGRRRTKRSSMRSTCGGWPMAATCAARRCGRCGPGITRCPCGAWMSRDGWRLRSRRSGLGQVRPGDRGGRRETGSLVCAAVQSARRVGCAMGARGRVDVRDDARPHADGASVR